MQIVAADLDGDALTFTGEGLPSGLNISTSGLITGTPLAIAASSVKITVSDGLLPTASTTFTWTVTNTPTGAGVVVDTPQVDITFSNITTAGNTSVTPVVVPPNQAPAGFSLNGLSFDVTTTATFAGPITLCFDVSSLSLNPTAFEALRVLHQEGGVFVDRTIRAILTGTELPGEDDLRAGTSLSPFAIASVVDVNDAPVVTSPGNQASVEGAVINLPITVTDADTDDTVTLTATGLPLSLQIVGKAITGTVSSTPSVGSPHGDADRQRRRGDEHRDLPVGRP